MKTKELNLSDTQKQQLDNVGFRFWDEKHSEISYPSVGDVVGNILESGGTNKLSIICDHYLMPDKVVKVLVGNAEKVALEFLDLCSKGLYGMKRIYLNSEPHEHALK